MRDFLTCGDFPQPVAGNFNPGGFSLLSSLPILGISGFSGSGKTTLIEGLLPALAGQGLRLAVVKHDAHQPEVDRPGKDSDRLFRAGADLFLHSAREHFSRRHAEGRSLGRELLDLCRQYDLVLVEGYKHLPLPKLWLLGRDEALPPSEVGAILSVLPWDVDRVGEAAAFLQEWLPGQWRKTPVHACFLVGQDQTAGALDMIGSHLQAIESWAHRIIVVSSAPVACLAGSLHLPPCPDYDWPLGGIIAAMRWAPFAAVMALTPEGLARDAVLAGRMLDRRRPGRWAVFAGETPAGRFPLPAYLDFRSLPLLEELASSNGRLSPPSLG